MQGTNELFRALPNGLAPLDSTGSIPSVYLQDKGAQVFNVKSYGATGNGTTDDTTAINKALLAANAAGGGVVFVPTGTYLTSAPLVIYSNTAMQFNPLATILLATGSNCNMLIDYAHSINSQTVPSVMQNISIQGGIWNFQNNNGSNNSSHIMVLGGTNISVNGAQFTSTSGKYAILFQNAINFRATNIFMNNTYSDGVHIQGPASGGYVNNIYGTTNDDMVSITPCDYAVYTWGNEGNVSDIVIDSIFPVNGTTTPIKVLGGTTNSGANVLTVSQIVVKNVVGTMTSAAFSAVYIGDDTNSPNTQGGQINDILIDGLNVTFPNTTTPTLNYIIFSGGTVSLPIQNVKICNVSLASDVAALIQVFKIQINILTLDNVSGYTNSIPMQSVLYLNGLTNSASILRLHMSNIDITFAGTVNGSYFGNVIRAIHSAMLLNDVNMSNVYVANAGQFVLLQTTTTFKFSNVHLYNNASLLNVLTTGVLLIASANGFVASNVTSTITSTGTVESQAIGFPLDITNAQVIKNNGDACTTTVTAGSIAAGSPVIYDSTNSHWYKVANQTTY